MLVKIKDYICVGLFVAILVIPLFIVFFIQELGSGLNGLGKDMEKGADYLAKKLADFLFNYLLSEDYGRK